MSPKIVLCKMMTAVILPLEVHKLSCWHLFPYLTGNISLEFADSFLQFHENWECGNGRDWTGTIILFFTI